MSIAPVTIRPATRADLADVRRLVRGLAEYEKLAHVFIATEADFDSMLFADGHPADAILACVADHKPVGIALFHRTVNTFRGKTGLFLEDLFVEPAHRGGGIGKTLLRALAELADARGHTIIEWRVLDWNEPAIAFYERLGATRMTEWHVRRLEGSALAALAQGDETHG